jgi:hypothetical protein
MAKFTLSLSEICVFIYLAQSVHNTIFLPIVCILRILKIQQNGYKKNKYVMSQQYRRPPFQCKQKNRYWRNFWFHLNYLWWCFAPIRNHYQHDVWWIVLLLPHDDAIQHHRRRDVNTTCVIRRRIQSKPDGMLLKIQSANGNNLVFMDSWFVSQEMGRSDKINTQEGLAQQKVLLVRKGNEIEWVRNVISPIRKNSGAWS